MQYFKRSIALLLIAVMTIQMFFNTNVSASSGIIKNSQFYLNEQNSNFKEYDSEDWEVVFPLGTFVVEYSQYTVSEGGKDTYLGINIARFGGKNSKVVLEYMVNDITTSEGDYEVSSNNIVFEPGEEVKTVYIKINDNNISQTDRYFAFTLVDAGDAHIGDFNRALIKIVDDEPYIPTVLTASAPAVVDKADGKVVVTLRRTQGVEYFFTVDVSTYDLTGVKNEDYIEVKKTITFQPKEVEHTIEIPLIHNDVKDTNGKYFKVVLSNPKGGEIREGSTELVIKATNNVPDPSYVKVNSESFGKWIRDKSGNIIINGNPIMDNYEGLDTSNLSTKEKVSMFFSAMSGKSVAQMASYTKWTDSYRVINDKKHATTIFKNIWGKQNDYLDDGILDEDRQRFRSIY